MNETVLILLEALTLNFENYTKLKYGANSKIDSNDAITSFPDVIS